MERYELDPGRNNRYENPSPAYIQEYLDTIKNDILVKEIVGTMKRLCRRILP